MTVVFKNTGIVPIEAFTTFGVNAKVGPNPIGEFGTGLKYAVAVVLRLGGQFRLWRGMTEYVFYTSEQDFRGKTFSWVRMRKRRGLGRWAYSRLPFTTELGKKWEPWQALREIESNCRDEDGRSFTISVPEAPEALADATSTVIAIDCPEIEEQFHNLAEIFLPKARLVLHETDDLQILRGRSKSIFYRGLRVTELRHPSLFTYNFKSGIVLTEDRTSKYPYGDAVSVRNALLSCANPDVISTLLGVKKGERFYENDVDFDSVGTGPSPALLDAIRALKAGGSSFGLGRLSLMYDNYVKKSMPGEEFVSVTARRSEWERMEALLPENDPMRMRIRAALTPKPEMPF